MCTREKGQRPHGVCSCLTTSQSNIMMFKRPKRGPGSPISGQQPGPLFLFLRSCQTHSWAVGERAKKYVVPFPSFTYSFPCFSGDAQGFSDQTFVTGSTIHNSSYFSSLVCVNERENESYGWAEPKDGLRPRQTWSRVVASVKGTVLF